MWRCLAASAELEEARGGHEAAALWAEAAGEIDFLAGGLNDERLQATFLARPEVAGIRAAVAASDQTAQAQNGEMKV